MLDGPMPLPDGELGQQLAAWRARFAELAAEVAGTARALPLRWSWALLLMLSIVNDAVAQKGPGGLSFGSSVVALLARYASLLLQSMLSSRRVLVLASMGSGVAAGCFGVRALLQAREDCECEK